MEVIFQAPDRAAKSNKIRASSKLKPLPQKEVEVISQELTAAENEYKKAIEQKNKNAYQDYCSNLSHPKNLAKVPRTKRKPWEELNVLRKPDGSYTEDSEETLNVLASEHFPDSEKENITHHTPRKSTSVEDAKTISKILNSARMDRVVNKLPTNKAPGLDGVRNKMIKAAWPQIKEPLQHIFNQCLIYSHCPKIWKTSKGIIIPKEGKEDYTNPRSYRIISLTSNLQNSWKE